MEAPPELVRGEDVLDIPLGTVLTSEKGQTYLFAGWRATTVGYEAIFVQAYRDKELAKGWNLRHHGDPDPWTYHASIADTLIRKFPGLAEFDTRRKAGTDAT